MVSWRDDLEGITSMGAAHKGVTRLADLAQARKEHLGQFFTPLEVVRKMWDIVDRVCENKEGRTISVLDNSMGSARMFHFADPKKHKLFGLDVHRDVVQEVTKAAESVGFDCEFACGGMEDASIRGMTIALINPPFSLNLQSPAMNPFPCTRWGKFGPNSGATSDEYALAQALAASQIVIAVLPTSTASDLLARGNEILGENVIKRLTAIFDLGSKIFIAEGANVATSIVVFNSIKTQSPCIRESVTDLDSWTPPTLPLQLIDDRWDKPFMRMSYESLTEPAITMPVTGNKVVKVVHNGRKIHLKFECGLMKARCLNAIYSKRIFSTENHRLPKGILFAGQGVLDVENLVCSADFDATWDKFLRRLKMQGAIVEIDPGLLGYISRRRREAVRQNTPFGRWIWTEQSADEVKATAKVTVAFQEDSWTSPVVKAGQQQILSKTNDGWQMSLGSHSRSFGDVEARKLFDIPSIDSGWREIAKPLQALFPDIAASLRASAIKLGIDRFLNWKYQFEDLLEICMRPGGCVVAWKQGLGKARLAVAIPLLLNTKHALVAMPAFLLDEFPDRLNSAGIETSMWQIIRSEDQAKKLNRINVISYERLRMKVPGKKYTYAALLRHRCGVVICDEGEVLANSESDQSRAIAQLAAKRLFVLTGTPQANYPRDLLPLSIAAVGDAVSGQPYGIHHPVLTEANVNSMEFAARGVSKFADDFVSFEWVTNEFTESLQDGAKREVPKIQNLDKYRQWIAPYIKRRLPGEPDVAEFVRPQKPDYKTIELDWDKDHLAHYLRVADEFANWWTKRKEDKRGQNLVALLARIGAVERANNVPQAASDGPSAYHGELTSKQRWVVNRAVEVAQRRKLVVYANSPALLDRFQLELNQMGVKSICYHGEIPTKERRASLQRFRHEDTNIALASLGVTRAGLDLYQASHVIFASRAWSATREDQAVYRLLRPQQTEQVTVERVHLKGSIDCYQDQMCTWKATSASSGLDWGTPMSDDMAFLHLDTVLGSFVDNLASLHGMKTYEFRKWAKEIA